MKSSTKSAAKSARDVAYYRQRYENRVHAKLVSWIRDECQRLQITKKEFAERMGKDPGLVSRLLSHPSNLTLNTITDLALALDAEAEPPEIVLFADRAQPNYVHPLIAKVTTQKATSPPVTVDVVSARTKTLTLVGSGTTIKASATAVAA